MNPIKHYALIIAMFAIILPSCKPTEKNYKEAYDAAVNKRNKVDEDLADVPGGVLLNDDAPKPVTVNGISFFEDHIRIKPEEADKTKLSRYSVATDMFKMRTNAMAQVADLIKEGYDAFAAKAAGDKWYVIAGSVATREEAMSLITKFIKSHPTHPYIGLNSAPLLIQ